MQIVRKQAAKGKAAKGKESNLVKLTAGNARRLGIMSALVKAPQSHLINLMVKESLDMYLEAWTGNLVDLVDGWTYDTDTEAMTVAAAINKWVGKRGKIRAVGKRLVREEVKIKINWKT